MSPERTVTVTLDLTVYDIRRLTASLRDAAENNGIDAFADIANQIDLQTRPPIPGEPADPAARVVDRNGRVWASHEGTWHHLSSGHGMASREWIELVEIHGPVEVVA